jgi:hypothetical protein
MKLFLNRLGSTRRGRKVRLPSSLRIRGDLRPVDSETVQILSQSIGVIHGGFPVSRNAEQPASGIRQRARIPAYVNHARELHSVKEIDSSIRSLPSKSAKPSCVSLACKLAQAFVRRSISSRTRSTETRPPGANVAMRTMAAFIILPDKDLEKLVATLS